MEPLKVLLVGTGAVGSLYGGKLAQAGAEVTALCRSDFSVVKEKGITINSVNGDFHFTPYQVIQNASEIKHQPELILVALKVLPEIDTVALIKDAVATHTRILLLQNGYNIEEAIQSAFPKNEIISGLAFVCSNRLAPGVINHIDYGHIAIGQWKNDTIQSTIEAAPNENEKQTNGVRFIDKLAALFQSAGVKCDVVEDIIQARWKKLVWNAPFNPISVLAGGISTHQIMNDQECRNLAKNIMQEIVSLSQIEGHGLPATIIDQNLDLTTKMKPYKTSMLLDYENSRQMEVEAILGNVVRFARLHHSQIPYLETIYSLLAGLNRWGHKISE